MNGLFFAVLLLSSQVCAMNTNYRDYKSKNNMVFIPIHKEHTQVFQNEDNSDCIVNTEGSPSPEPEEDNK